MNCPKCGHTFVAPECYSTEQDGDSYINYLSAYCPWCCKEFGWMEVFTLSEITPPEEIQENDHL